jgi:NAD(P)H-dependent FMN reductase
MKAMRLMIIWGSSRPARQGGTVIDWVRRHASADKRLEVDFVDLKELGLPFFDEPLSPFSMVREGKDYTNPKGKSWADRVGRAEAVLIVTPEYNHGPAAVLKNSLDWVGPEWVDKPVGFVSYGGISGGARAIEQLRTITIELGLIQVANPIHFVFFKKAFNQQAEPIHESTNQSLAAMFDELERLHEIFCLAKKHNLSAGQACLE